MRVNLFHPSTTHQQAGYLVVLVLVFGGIFMVIISGFIGFVVTQSQVVNQRLALEQAGEVAEAGLNYYRWYLAHNPSDVTAGTGTPGPYVFPYEDPELGVIGEFSLAIASTTYCGAVSSIDVTATGVVYSDPSVQRTVSARYTQPTIAEYAFILNADVWAGADRIITGPYHNNNGIRMDGRNDSVVSSVQTSWTCTNSFGCSPTQTVDGVWASPSSNANTALFSFPASLIQFANIDGDIDLMRDRAINGGGIHIPGTNEDGYWVIFNANGTVTIREVTNTYSYTAENSTGTFTERNIIQSYSTVGTYPINPSCPLIFVEDKVWLEGVVGAKVTIAAASTTDGIDQSIILEGNITYNNPETDGLLALAEHDVLLGVEVPNDMTVNGIFVAQGGRYGRNHYTYSWLPNPPGPTNYKPYYDRNSLTMIGTVVSNGRVGTQWVSSGSFISGFRNRTNSFDRNLVDDPPPLLPSTSEVYDFVRWREVE